MNRTVGVWSIVFAYLCGGRLARAAEGLPDWAYGIPPSGMNATVAAPASPSADSDQGVKHLAGSSLGFTAAQIRDGFAAVDWYPEDHPAMPDIVAHGRKPDVRACAYCHYPNGKGRPENAPVSGLPIDYFIQQMLDFKNGNRKTAAPGKPNSMIGFVKAMSDEEIRQSAIYFGSMKWTPAVRVVETSKVPKTKIVGGMFVALDGQGEEPLGERIIEVPENAEATQVLRDPRSGFVAYVPVGSIQKGRELAMSDSDSGRCQLCHGADLAGLGPLPGIAGRSPTYLVRQFYDMQQGTRKGAWAGLMTPVTRNLTQSDMLSLAAYIASLKP